jgi:hypothetical protein
MTKKTFFSGDKQGLHVRSEFQISMRALGGIIWLDLFSIEL